MRILHVIQPPYGGSVTAMLLLARDQVARHDVGVICHSAGNAAETARGFGARVWTLPAHRAVRPREDFRHLLLLRRMIGEFDPEVLHLHSSKAGVLGRVAGRSRGVPVVYSPHNFAYRSYEGAAAARAAFYLVERALAPLTDSLHVVSQEEYDAALRRRMSRPGRCTKIHNAIDLDALLALPAPPARTPAVIGTFARLYRQKRLDLLLDAFAELRRRGVPFRGLVVGAGPLRDELRSRASALGLDGIVEFDDRPHDAAAALRRIDIFALTSSHEVGPLTVMEAMAAGRPVVTTRVGVVPEIVESGRTAIDVAPDAPHELVDALQRLLEDVPLRHAIAAAGREGARRRFGPHVMAAKMEDVYARAIERRRRRRRIRFGRVGAPQDR